MEVINTGMRKTIKGMCVAAQTLQFISLMPRPEDFVIRLTSDIVYLSSQVQVISDRMNELLDDYADIPANYLMTQVNSITGSLINVTNNLDLFSQISINETLNLGENTADIISAITGTAIDTTGAFVNTMTGMGHAVAHGGASILGQGDIAEDIQSSAESVFEWTGDGFQQIKEDVTAPLQRVTQTIEDAKITAVNAVGKTTEKVENKIVDTYEWVDNLISKLRDEMAKLSNYISNAFKDLTTMSQTSNNLDTFVDEMNKMDNQSASAQIITSSVSTVSTVIKNFNIGKVLLAFGGLFVEAGLVRLGLNEIPPINCEAMLCKIRDDVNITSEELFQEYNSLYEDTSSLIKFSEDISKIPSEERNYSSDNYDEFMKEFDGELKEQRDKIRTMLKYTKNDDGSMNIAADTLAKREIKSAIKEMEKYRKKVKKAKKIETYKSILSDELKLFVDDAKYRCESIKYDWQYMMSQYTNACKEIKSFFVNGGSCSMFIDDCCDEINKSFNDIKELCKGLSKKLICVAIKIVSPADIGAVVPNPIYKIADFWSDIKTIFQFIKDLIGYVLKIINNVNKIARIMINGIYSLGEIVSQLMEMLNLKWLMDLIQSIINALGENISNAKIKMENTLSPVYFNDTEEYENTLEALDSYMEYGEKENGRMHKEELSILADTVNLLSNVSKSNKKVEQLIEGINGIKKFKDFGDNEKEKVETLLDDLDERGNTIVAYKSPIIKDVGEPSTVSDLVDGKEMNNDIKFIGWHFYHPNLEHTGEKYYKNSGLFNKLLRKIKSKIIQKASKNGHKVTGGVNQLKRKVVGSKGRTISSAYNAFYWYTYYTEDMEKDCFERTAKDMEIIIDSVVNTSNGSIVELSDGRKVFVADAMVKSGDYVTVEGVKYRVK